MSYVMMRVAKCDICKRRWIPKVKKPVQCANQACKSRKWNWKAK